MEPKRECSICGLLLVISENAIVDYVWRGAEGFCRDVTHYHAAGFTTEEATVAGRAFNQQVKELVEQLQWNATEERLRAEGATAELEAEQMRHEAKRAELEAEWTRIEGVLQRLEREARHWKATQGRDTSHDTDL